MASLCTLGHGPRLRCGAIEGGGGGGEEEEEEEEDEELGLQTLRLNILQKYFHSGMEIEKIRWQAVS